MFKRLAAFALIACSAGVGLRAAPADDVLDALRLPEMLQVMREEGVSHGADLSLDMTGRPGNAQWLAVLDRIYDTDKMDTVMRDAFAEAFGDTPTDPLLAFFTSDLGKEIVALELDARRAMVDPDFEEQTREAYRLRAAREEDARREQVADFIATGDLIEANVAGALNASFQFYRGLIDGGAFTMSESDVLRDVWSQEEETRTDTREWLFAYLLLSYEALDDAEFQAYHDLSASDEGRALNRALFAGFNLMYDELSYALGLAVARQMAGEDL